MSDSLVTLKRSDVAEIERIYREAFPANEQLPFWFLRLAALRPRIEFLVFKDGADVRGFTYLISSRTTVFVLYLATDATARSRGYGGRILKLIAEHHLGKVLALNIERIDPATDNYEQRVKRLNFYGRNGFADSGFEMQDRKEWFTTLYKGVSFEPAELRKALRYFGLGFAPQLRRAPLD